MKEHCFDEGTIQAFLDGELASEMLEQVARHVALCDDCAMLLAESEEESAFAFAALEDEFNSLVPTERIRTNLYQAISEIEKPKVSFWEKITNLRFVFSSPSLTAFAGLLIVAGLFAIVWQFNSRNNVSITEMAQAPVINRVQPENPVVAPVRETTDDTTAPARIQTISEKAAFNRQKAVNTDYRPKYQNAKYTVESTRPAAERTATVNAAPAELVAGEKTYIKTIDTLSKTVDANKGVIMSASARVAYEKDMAMVNDAIAKMKTEVRKNPKNEVAKEVLRNSYQNKIDLMNSVAEQSQMVAGLD